MKMPNVFTAQALKDWDVEMKIERPSAILGPKDIWVPARPESLSGLNLVQRLRVAWAVFTGKYDAVDWDPEKFIPLRMTAPNLHVVRHVPFTLQCGARIKSYDGSVKATMLTMTINSEYQLDFFDGDQRMLNLGDLRC